MDWILGLLTTCIHHSKLHFTDHDTHKLVSSVYYSLFPGNGFYQSGFFNFPHSGPLVTDARAELPLSWQLTGSPRLAAISHRPPTHLHRLSSNWLNSLTHQPATSRHFTQLNYWRLTAAQLVSSLYNICADETENTASNNPSIIVICGCLATDWMLTQERVYRAVA
jgi:hypothetical protein